MHTWIEAQVLIKAEINTYSKKTRNICITEKQYQKGRIFEMVYWSTLLYNVGNMFAKNGSREI